MLFPAVLFVSLSLCSCDRPNIVFIIADDLGITYWLRPLIIKSNDTFLKPVEPLQSFAAQILPGWNDVGFHGLNQIPTPNLDALASSGILLHNYYVTPICTPSRSAIMTGKYPIHTGMQHTVIFGTEPRGLPLSEKILPQYLKDLGYKTHLIGKWHLGSYKKKYLPMYRGFDSHVGFWSGKIDMFDHTNQEKHYWGFDFRRGFSVAHDLFGHYATDIYTNEAIKVINSHNKSEPLFLMVSHSAVHSGNPSEPIRAPEALLANFTHIKDFQRQKFAAVLSKLDESVGEVVDALHTRGLLENSVVIFTTDNGGPAEGFNDNRASNYPLRGVKNTLWEGGVRGAGFLWSPLIEKKSRISKQMFHLVDWLPTLLSVAGFDVSSLQGLDGIDQWEALSKDLKSKRVSILHNIDDIFGSAAITVDKWKLHKGTNYNGAWDGWYGPSGREGNYDSGAVQDARVARALKELGLMPDLDTVLKLRDEATVKCDNTNQIVCNPLQSPCLFNIEEDPCERRNLADAEPTILRSMLEELEIWNKTAIPPNNEPLDPRGEPKFWGQVITNFGDYENLNANALC